MSRCRLAVGSLLALVVAACGSSTALTDGGAPPGDAGTTVDAGTRVDAGAPPDAGCPTDGGCPLSGCPDVSGAYQVCADCGALGRFGPFDVDIAHTCGCAFQGCVRQDGGAPQCGNGCIDTQSQMTVTLRVMGISVNCSGPYTAATHSATLNCPLGALGNCMATLRQDGGTTCP